MGVRDCFVAPPELSELVQGRMEKLRASSFDDLAFIKDGGDDISVKGLNGFLWTYVERHDDSTVRTIVQGTLHHRWLPLYSVHVEGFEKRKDGTMRELQKDEMYDYD